MKPHHIQISGGRYGRWVDLEAIQMVTDPFIPSRLLPDNPSFWRMYPPATFTIQFAFQNKVVEISSDGQSDDPDVEKHIEELLEQHALLLAAWKNL